jgi:hypothetical protein
VFDTVTSIEGVEIFPGIQLIVVGLTEVIDPVKVTVEFPAPHPITVLVEATLIVAVGAVVSTKTVNVLAVVVEEETQPFTVFVTDSV